MSRPQPLAAESGVRKKPSAERGPKASMAIRQPPSTITTGLRQSAGRSVADVAGAISAVTDRSALDGLDIGICSGRNDGEALHRLLHDRQVDQPGKHAEQNRQPPDGVIGAGALERKTAEQDAEEAT